jgi:hypothetical protein
MPSNSPSSYAFLIKVPSLFYCFVLSFSSYPLVVSFDLCCKHLYSSCSRGREGFSSHLKLSCLRHEAFERYLCSGYGLLIDPLFLMEQKRISG